MTTFATIVSYASGFALMRLRATPAEVLGTSLAIDAALAPLTALWGTLGFVFGAWALFWALVVLSVRPARIDSPPPGFPPTSDAA